jgi:hypothetical protein
MQFDTGLVSDYLPTHFFCIHARKIFVFAVTADIAFANSVVQLTSFVFKLVNAKTLTDVSTVDDETFSHV